MLLRPAISSHSLGRAWVHDFETKLESAAEYGLDLGLFYEDIEHIAKRFPGGTSEHNLVRAARLVRRLCDQVSIEIICLQPFMHYEGLRDRSQHAARVEEMKLWLQLAVILGTQLIGIPSSFLSKEEIIGDLDLIVSDLRELADLGTEHNITFSYEALCWGTYINTWEQAWKVVQEVNRSNFGLCLDTFHVAGKVYADPEAHAGMTAAAELDMAASLERLRKIDVDKVFCVQVVDAERLQVPMSPQHLLYDETQPTRMTWSRNCRLFYGETELGAYLPIHDILQVVLLDLGYAGLISAEVFHACLTDPAPTMPNQLACRAALSWRRIIDDFAMQGRLSSSVEVEHPIPSPHL